MGTSGFSSRPSHICRNLPETFLRVPNRFSFTGRTLRQLEFMSLTWARVDTRSTCALRAWKQHAHYAEIVLMLLKTHRLLRTVNDEVKATVPGSDSKPRPDP